MKAKYEKTLKILTETLWEGKVRMPQIYKWEKNFSDEKFGAELQQDHAIFLLTKFMYFGNREIRELLKSLYRDLFRYSIIEKIRKANHDTIDSGVINPLFEAELKQTRFLGIGNPSESGSHLLYYFRQENNVDKNLFINTHEIFNRYGSESPASLAKPEINRYVLLDDFTGSGNQAIEYSKSILEDLSRLNPEAETSYLVLFGSTSALKNVRDNTKFKQVLAVMEFDDSFKCFDENSRFFQTCGPEINKDTAKEIVQYYGEKLLQGHALEGNPLGFSDGQFLFGFFHNTPDSTLPIFWYDNPESNWAPIFRRYQKVYS